MKSIINTFLVTLITVSCYAQYRDENKAMKYSSTYHINVFLNVGGGFDQLNTGIITNTGEAVTISAGGGAGIGLQFGYTMPSPSLDFSLAAFAQVSVLQPPLQNVDGTFSRVILEPMVKYIFEIKKIKSSINAGLGLDYALNSELNIDASQIPPTGERFILNYDKPVGPVVMLEYQFRIKKISLSAGLKYYSLNYTLESGEYNGVTYPAYYFTNDVNKLDGSGFDLTLGFGFYF